MNIGFEFHPSKKWQAGRSAVSSWLIFAVIVSFAAPFDQPFAVVFQRSPAIIFAALIFLIFSFVLTAMFIRILRQRFVLELSETHIIDFRGFRPRSIRYQDVEIFSPKPEAIFSPEPKVKQIRESFGLRDHIDLACRLRGDGSDFLFSSAVALPTVEQQKQIVARLTEKIAVFDNLYADLGDDVGGDASEFDETQS